MRQFAAPVAQRLLDELQLHPGAVVLDIAAGVGETGLLAAGRVAPGGRVIIGDQAEAMLAAADRRARELGIENVELRRLDAEWLDLSVGEVDALLCRWGLMLMADPDAALREFRRVLKPGGRLALAVWGAAERNPWVSAVSATLIERGLMPTPEPAPPGGFMPGMFALCDPQALSERIQDAGFHEVTVGEVAVARRHASFEEFWDTTLDMSVGVHDAVMERPAREIEQIVKAVRAGLGRFIGADGTMEIPGLAVVAAARA